MSDFNERINQLEQRLQNLAKYQQYFQKEIANIHFELKSLKTSSPQTQTEIEPKPQPTKQTAPNQPFQNAEQSQAFPKSNYQPQSNYQPPKPIYDTPPIQPKVKSDLEKFIGENLISKIGIVILVLGVGIGAKYAIDNDLISPLTRIILGYFFGFGLLAVAIRLKEKYLNFSAVLLSGAMAIMYFITFFAHSLYGLIAPSSAFVLMLIFTVFTVLTAIIYNRVIIAHFGLVGAYTIPFLLSDGSGNYAFLFGYVSIINIGILAISLRKYWKSLFYSSFIVTWLTFSGWYLFSFKAAEQYTLALTFATVFFAVFYLTFLSYKVICGEKFTIENVFLILANSFIFYGFGYSIISSRAGGSEYLGLFTVFNAMIHFAAAFALNKLKLADKSVIYLTTALVLTFITIAVPVQFEGNWITLLWTAEAAFLFAVGRTKNLPLYEYFSYPLMFLASVSLLTDWQQAFNRTSNDFAVIPIFNVEFLTAILFVAAFAFIQFLNTRYESALGDTFYKITTFVIPTVLLVALFNTFRIEIGNYWHYRFVQSGGAGLLYDNPVQYNEFNLFSVIWQINYSVFFLTILSFVNIKKIKSAALGLVNLGLNLLIDLIFLTGGLYTLGLLREGYLAPENATIFSQGIFNVFLRYISFVLLAALFVAIYKYIKQKFIKDLLPNENLIVAFDFVLHISILAVASSELINWMDIFGYGDSYKIGLSILWGLYALLLISLGIYRNKKHLRIGAIALFALTLIKLFIYDIAELNTISKTVVFVSLGILLLTISFLYNKYKHLIVDKNGQ